MAGRNNTGAVAQPPAVQKEQQLYPAANNGEISAQFMRDVIREYGTTIGVPELNGYQKRLIQSYFIGIDRALAEAESRRNSNNPPIDWQHVYTPSLFIDVVNCVKLGLDMAQPNHVFAIPFFNNRTGLYDVTLMKGYAGIAYIAMKYAADPPRNVTLQLVYSTDKFKPHMKCAENDVENYEFEITNPFDRGKIIGGFGYIEYADPKKNCLVMMSRADMDKRKPERASRNFWGKWDDEMYLKTLARHVYSERYIPRAPLKTDEAYQQMKLREVQYAALEAETEVSANANRGPVIEVPVRTASLPEASTVQAEIPAARGEQPYQQTIPPVDWETGEVLDAGTQDFTNHEEVREPNF